MNTEPVVLFLMRPLTQPEGAWGFIFNEDPDPTTGVIWPPSRKRQNGPVRADF
ncbi:hypothetical protein ACPFL9_00935 [Paenarthrobacter sp. NyZ202]|uniref:hypothetical protein n=1 Tax=Paenarthrobacter sp. NyZ202 TaxID=3402689 RepID=UPI003CF70318